MLQIDRSAVEIPLVLRRGVGSLADKDYERAAQFYASEPGLQRQRVFDFKAYRHPEVKEALLKLFHGKCAYCETPLSSAQPVDIEHYRPKSGVLDNNGVLLPLHYWWLANEWSNLYVACAHCNRISKQSTSDGVARIGKGGRFPIEDESFRADLLTPVHRLVLELPLLLDPCVDPVESILVFTKNGLVSCTDRRGLTTIEILGLNRSSLVANRREMAGVLLQRIEALLSARSDQQLRSHLLLQVAEMSAPNAPYASMCRQLSNAELLKHAPTDSEWRLIQEAISPNTLQRTDADEKAAADALKKYREERENYSLESASAEAIAAYVSTGERRVERVTVRNFRAIGSVTLPLLDAGGPAPWLMLLGENASGKSSVLQAIALSLVSDKYRRALVQDRALDLGQMVKSGAPFAQIEIKLSGATEPRVLKIYPNGDVETKGRAAQLILLAYGSTRLLPRAGKDKYELGKFARAENLFDPFEPLVDAEQWLLGCDEEQFDYAARAIKMALNVAEDSLLLRSNGEIGLSENGNLIAFKKLCDGYQTVIALVADILSAMLPTWRKPEFAEGLVLIDEVGNHLHPSWRLRFVSSMREIMPGVQVIATTHEPLCLRGLKDGEIAVLRRGPRGGVSVVENLPSIEGLRIDQILTSEHFGLDSTLDPHLQKLFDEYHQLLRQENRAPEQELRLVDLRTDINQMQGLGNSERERRMLAAIDRFLAQTEKEVNFGFVAHQDVALNEELEAIWRDARNLAERAN